MYSPKNRTSFSPGHPAAIEKVSSLWQERRDKGNALLDDSCKKAIALRDLDMPFECHLRDVRSLLLKVLERPVCRKVPVLNA